nr:PEPxxWA-CTERM sorting domain-containing protein [Phenylobacterium sp.]
MLKKLAFAAVLAASALTAAPAWAVSTVEIINEPCSLTTGCLFSGNDNDPADIEAAYADVFGAPPLGLVFLFKYTPSGGAKETSGTWNWPTPVSYISVKAANNFMLYKVDPTVSSGPWSTIGLDEKDPKKLKDLSHYTLWGGPGGSAVPEPATWAMMIIGFGAAGSMLRSVRRKEALAAA